MYLQVVLSNRWLLIFLYRRCLEEYWCEFLLYQTEMIHALFELHAWEGPTLLKSTVNKSEVHVGAWLPQNYL